MIVGKNNLDTYTQVQWFVQGLPASIRNELCYRVELSKKKKVLMFFDDMLLDVLFMVEARKKMSDMVRLMVRLAGSADKMMEWVAKRGAKVISEYQKLLSQSWIRLRS